MSPKARKTLLELGQRASARWGRVSEARARQLVTVLRSHRRKTSWPLSDEGRAEAIAWARAYHEEAQRPAPVPVEPVTNGQLWRRYAEAMFGDLRPKTVTGHKNRWRLWEAFLGHHADAYTVTLEHLDQFKAELLRQEFSPNQVRHVFTLVKSVYRWGQSRRLLVSPEVGGYRLRMARDLRGHAPAEYRLEEWERILLHMGSPQDSRTWRPWALWMLVGHQGIRVNAALHLRVEDVREGRLHWRPEHDKRGRTWSQPIRHGALSAILTALAWRAHDTYGGPWLFYPPSKARAWDEAHEPYFQQALADARRLAIRRVCR